LKLALSKGSNRVGATHLLTGGRKQIQFPGRCILAYFLEYQTMDKVQKPSKPESPHLFMIICQSFVNDGYARGFPRPKFMYTWYQFILIN
jgi:hypothetical protein